LNQSDPTDHALAAIASILDRPVENLAPKVEAEPAPKPEAPPAVEVATAEPEILPIQSPVPPPAVEIDIDHYEKFGPGPLDAIRFRWAARRDDFDNYYVDETIGPNSRPLSSGPMPKSQVVRFIDERAQDAEQRYNTMKNKMTISAREPDHPRDNGGES
jgi:hypothetical protein